MSKEPGIKWSERGYWDERFKQSDTPWELGHASEALLEACSACEHLAGPLKGKRILVPGCGTGSDALALAGKGADVIAVDWSAIALESLRSAIAREGTALSGSLSVYEGDVFSLPLPSVDVVAEHTLFCAIDPSRRREYVELLLRTLVPGGYLAGNLFILSEEEVSSHGSLSLAPEGEGPPFVVTPADIERLFGGSFERLVMRPASACASGRRAGMEWVCVFRRVS